MKYSTKISIIFFITLIFGMLSTFLLLLWANMSTTECEKVEETKENCLVWNGTKCVYKCNKKVLLISGSVSLIIFIGLFLYLRHISILNRMSNFIHKMTD